MAYGVDGKMVQFVEFESTHAGFVRLRVKVARGAAERIQAYCRGRGLHSMVFYRDVFDGALDAMVGDLGLMAEAEAEERDVGF